MDALPLALYVHVPWCVRKCPYCDFNSHDVDGPIPEEAYLAALLRDLEEELPRVWGRRLTSIFIGGGTPSLLTGEALEALLAGVRARLPVVAGAEVTLEANPGTVEAGRFAAYRASGVNRLSLGIQSFDDTRLHAIGRIHDRRQALAAVAEARTAGFDNLNLDLMFGLPQQRPEEALAELRQAIDLAPQHLSWYQLTVEPNTAFFHHHPPLPDDEALWEMQEQGEALLAGAGFDHYEVSAYARDGRRCRHNLNYWEFGDYLGIGAGAHGKLTLPDGEGWRVVRRAKPRHPRDYLGGAPATEETIANADLPGEFMLNALRLRDGFPPALFEARTGLPRAAIEAPLARAEALGLLERERSWLHPTERGRLFLNDLITLFL